MTTQTPEQQHEAAKPGSKDEDDLSTVQVITSTLSAFFGVQSKENKVRDFQRGKLHQFIIAGAVLTLLLLVGIITVVNLVV